MAQNTSFFNHTFVNEKGASFGWLFLGKTNRTASGVAVVKVFCIPLPKLAGGVVRLCDPVGILKNIRLLLGIERVVEE